MISRLLRRAIGKKLGRPEWSFCEDCGNNQFVGGPEGCGFIHYICTECGTVTINGNGANTKEVSLVGGYPWGMPGDFPIKPELIASEGSDNSTQPEGQK